jgi:hypothetical protein
MINVSEAQDFCTTPGKKPLSGYGHKNFTLKKAVFLCFAG